jgi:tetratricopeptide (TPR) repeat protein
MMEMDAFSKDRELIIREKCDPVSAYLQLVRGEELLASGDSARALEMFGRATATDPSLVGGWQRLGNMQLEVDANQGKLSLIKALRATRLPLPYAGAGSVTPDIFATLGNAFDYGDEVWKVELERFLEGSVTDVRSLAESALHEAASVELARFFLKVGERTQAVSVCANQLARAKAFEGGYSLINLQLLLVETESELGDHDEAELHLRSLLRSDDGAVVARARLALGRIVVWRQERWAEEILRRAWEGLVSDLDRCRCQLLLGQRAVLGGNYEEADHLLGSALALAELCKNRSLLAKVWVAMGDSARGKKDMEVAQESWQKARAFAKECNDQEVLLRLVLRRGDILAMNGELEGAIRDYETAVDGYRGLQLALREGWALLRLGRIGGSYEVFDQARACFKRCDFAVGVAAVDTLVGDPKHSLQWHLSRSAAHSRRRLDAQRCKAPLDRADADRPERRLSAHRNAVAATGVEVVEALVSELSTLAKEIDFNSVRVLDPSLATYVAAADLLAAHRSYEAASALMQQLTEVRPSGVAERALKSAITRSPNVVLVDALLQTVENPSEGLGLASAVEILGWRRERAAVVPITALLKGRTLPVKRAAVVALGRIGEVSAVPDLLEQLEDKSLGADVAVALLLLGDRRGVDFHAQSLAAGAELESYPGEVVGRYGGPSYLLLLRSTADGEGPKALGALQGLGYLGDTRGVTSLLGAMSSKNPHKRAVAAGALEMITGHQIDPEQPGVHTLWERYWEEHEKHFQAGVRYRDGRILDLGLLVEKMSDTDPLVRRGAYDEIVISTGENLPFDADGPWRVQANHVRAWSRWCRENADRFTLGNWWFNGEAIG